MAIRTNQHWLTIYPMRASTSSRSFQKKLPVSLQLGLCCKKMGSNSSRYVKLRKQGTQNKTITATPRQLESLIRLSEARAKMRWNTVISYFCQLLRFSENVEALDVQEALLLMETALKQAATDPITGIPIRLPGLL